MANAVVSSCHPQRLCQSLQGFFDKVLVDAPCSGEGMFRRDPAAVAQWSPESPAACAQRQRAILDSAALAVREGGVLVYSTCTFSQEENEDNVRWFLSAHPEFALAPIEAGFGRPGVGGLPVRRIYPMDGGEGHFVAKFQRVGENVDKVGTFTAYLSCREEGEFQGLFEELCKGYRNCEDTDTFEALFYMLTGITFQEFLDRCVKETCVVASESAQSNPEPEIKLALMPNDEVWVLFRPNLKTETEQAPSL